MGIRTRICKKTRGKKRNCFYVVRDKNGRFKKWTNIGRSTRVDTRIRAKRRLKRSKPGYGHLGDYR